MSAGFDWQTEETQWEEPPAAGSRRRPRLWRRLRFLALLTSVFVLALWLILRQINVRIEEGVANIEGDVLASHNLVLKANASADAELLENVLSGREEHWTDAQRGVIGAGLLFDRRAFGFEASGEPRTLTVDVAQDLQSARVTTEQAYVVAYDDGQRQTVVLQHQAEYRRGATAFLFAPPLEQGTQWTAFRGRRVTFTYRDRDKAFGATLARDLDAALTRLCQDVPGLGCAGVLLEVWLSDNPASLLTAQEAGTFIGAGDTLNLPSPLIFGQPVDDAGLGALRLRYLQLLLRATIAAQVGFDCCDQALFHQVLSNIYLATVGLAPAPLADYPALLAAPPTLVDLNRLWVVQEVRATNPGEANAIVGLLDLLEREGFGATELHRRLQPRRGEARFSSLFDWLRALAPARDIPAWEALWYHHLNTRAYQALRGGALTDPPLPEQDVALLCRAADDVNRAELLIWRPTIGAFDTIARMDQIGRNFVAFSDDGGVAWLIRGAAGGPDQRLIWRQGRLLRLDQAAFAGEPPPLLLGQMDPSGRFAVGVSEADPAGEGGTFPSYQLLDLTQCSAASCPAQALAGKPLWSPGGRQLLLVDASRATIDGIRSQPTLSFAAPDGRDAQARLTGWSPVWFDDLSFAFINYGPTLALSSVVLAQPGDVALKVDASWPQPVIAAAVPFSRRAGPGEGLVPVALWANPYDPDRLFILIEDEHLTHAVRYDRDRDDFDFAFSLDRPVERLAPRFSPDGRWLAIGGYTRSDNVRNVYLYDIIDGRLNLIAPSVRAEARSFPGMDWSADGQWLLTLNPGELELWAPNFDVQTTVALPGELCSGAYWVSPAGEASGRQGRAPAP